MNPNGARPRRVGYDRRGSHNRRPLPPIDAA